MASHVRSRKSSEICGFFADLGDGKAKCNYCSKRISYKGGNTFNLARHVRMMHPTVSLSVKRLAPPALAHFDASSEGNPGNPLPASATVRPELQSVPEDTSSTSTAVSQPQTQGTLSMYFTKPLSNKRNQEIDVALLEVKDYLPFSIVESRNFQKFVSKLNGAYRMPTRKTLSNTLLQQQYTMAKEMVKTKINSAEAVVLTMDGWTSVKNESYLSVTAHFVKDFELASCLLECFKYDERHTSENLAEELRRVTREWGIEEKVVCVVSDNAPNIVAAIRLTAWKNIPCFAHTLNLIVQNGLQHIQQIVNKVKKIVEFFKRSSQASMKLKKMQEQLKEPVLTLKQDIITRWNSTLDMLQRIADVKNSLMSVITINYPELNLTTDETESIKQACEVLKVFKDCTEEMSSEKVVTASKVILLSWSLKRWCSRFVNNNGISADAGHMAEKLLEELNRRFRNVEENSIFAEATLLDPQFKLHGFFDKNAGEKAKFNLIKHCEKYVTVASTATANISMPTPETISCLWIEFDEVFSRLQSNPHPKIAAKVEVDKYLQEPLHHGQGNPLQWWSERQAVYRSLFELAKMRLCIVATSTPCERVFSKAGHPITDRRNRLTGKRVEQIMFLNGNL